MKLGAPGEALTVHTVVEVLAVPGSVPETEGALVDVSAAAGHERSVGVFGVLGDDVDHSVDSVRSPDGATGTADHFDPVDVLEQCVLDIPPDTGKEWRVDAS